MYVLWYWYHRSNVLFVAPVGMNAFELHTNISLQWQLEKPLYPYENEKKKKPYLRIEPLIGAELFTKIGQKLFTH